MGSGNADPDANPDGDADRDAHRNIDADDIAHQQRNCDDVTFAQRYCQHRREDCVGDIERESDCIAIAHRDADFDACAVGDDRIDADIHAECPRDAGALENTGRQSGSCRLCREGVKSMTESQGAVTVRAQRIRGRPMAFCVRCGNQMREGGAFCGKCGTRTLARPASAGGRKTVRRILGGVFGLFGVLTIIGALVDLNQQTASDSSSDISGALAKPDFKVSAPELCREYVANSIAADIKYKGKLIEVSGMIKDINKDMVDTIYVILDAQNPESITDAQLYFSDAHEKEAAALYKGEYFGAVCRCDGKFMNVMLKDCEITASVGR